jgi:uncharacterized protein YdeI (YjbR/CyaY-like superfamily)
MPATCLVSRFSVDTEPRTVAVPTDLAAVLDAEPALRAAWDALSFTHQREHVEAVESARKPETRARRIESALRMVREKAANSTRR